MSGEDHRGVGAAIAVALLWAALSESPAGAQSTIDVGGADAPIEIDATEGIEWRRDEQLYVARGNVKVARGELQLFADTLTARYRDKDKLARIWQIEAAGNVRLTSAKETVFGERAIYNLDRDLVVFEGGALRIETAKQTVTAKGALEYWTKRRVLVARGGAVAVDGGRKVSADTLTAYFKETDEGTIQLYQVEAEGHVRITAKGGVARGTKAIYNLDHELAQLTGGVRITRGEVQLNGDRAEMNLKTGVSRLLGVPGKSKVHTLVVPASDSTGGQ